MNDFLIRLPRHNISDAGKDMRSWLQTWEWKRPISSQWESLKVDFSQVKFIEPWAFSMIVAHALSIKESRHIPVTALLTNTPSNQYIRAMGVEHVFNTGTSTDNWDSSIQNTGLHVIRTHEDVARFASSTQRLALDADNETIDAIKYSMAELGRNVVQHSGSPIGGVAMAQYFPDRRAIQISIADCGQGVKTSLIRTYPEIKQPVESLKLAVLPHVSGTFRSGTYSASDNAGLGLFFTKEIAWRAGGSFWLVSDNALLGVRDKDHSAAHRLYRTVQEWPGTMVTVDIPADGIFDFAGLLTMCRRLAEEARKSSGKLGLDFLDEEPDLEGLVRISVGDMNENVQKAAEVRENSLTPAIARGDVVLLDFSGTRFITQSFAHALLSDVLKIPGSLSRLSFINCTNSTKESIAMMAAYILDDRDTN